LNLPTPAAIWLGRVLIVTTRSDAGARLVEFGKDGEKVWEVKHPVAWSCRGLPDGHRLVGTNPLNRVDGSNHPKRVDEYDADGKLVWGLEVRGSPQAIQRLPGGNTLVTEQHDGMAKVREYRPDRSLCCEVSLPDFGTVYVDRLDGGNFLAAAPPHVVEVDRRGKVIWEKKDLKEPFSCQRIDNGNTLISEFDGDRVIEVDRSGKVVWSYKVQSPCQARRLPDGHTVICGAKGVFEIDPGANILWEREVVGGAFYLSAY
jgi:outer membrane protein assembly factor BamB